MKNWLKQEKWNILLSVALTFLPSVVGLLLWNRLPEQMATHWGPTGVDGVSGKGFAVFGMPGILAALNLVALVCTGLDSKQAEQHRKALRIVFWIMPILSLGVCGMVYSIALGRTLDMFMLLPLVMGGLFVALGNYMPKVKQNSTLGIKISWTLHNEENWNLTHRMAGKLWVACGLGTMFSALLPLKWMLPVLLVAALVAAVVPMVYSYRIYRRHLAAGIRYDVPNNRGQKAAKLGSILGGMIVLAIVGMLMLTGEIRYEYTDSALQIEATYHQNSVVQYNIIENIELRSDFEIGARSFGFGSPKLSMGYFRNTEFGDYTIYAYNACDVMIVIHSGEQVLAFNCQTAEETQALYQTLLTKIG